MFNVDLRLGNKIVVCKECGTKQQALEFIKTMIECVCDCVGIYLLERDDKTGEYSECLLSRGEIEFLERR